MNFCFILMSIIFTNQFVISYMNFTNESYELYDNYQEYGNLILRNVNFK